MTERVSPIPFSELIKTAPETTSPYVANLLTGKKEQWPFKLIEQPDLAKAVFVANSGLGHEGSPSRIEVTYEESHGLSAKRTLFYRTPEFGNKFLIESGDISIKSGELDITYAIAYNAIFVTEDLLNDHSNFTPTISVHGSNESVPPLASAKFDPDGQMPIDIQFPLADFDSATKGEIEQRRNKFDNRPIYRTNYFSLDKNGRKIVGVSKFEDRTSTFAGKEYSHSDLRFSGWYQDDNAFRKLEGSDYVALASRLNERLRFARQNIKTGEIWTLSVPEGIQREAFYGDVVSLPMADFFQKYPASFAVKKMGEKSMWVESKV